MTLFGYGIKLLSLGNATKAVSPQLSLQSIFKNNNVTSKDVRYVLGNIHQIHTSHPKNRRTPDLIYVPHVLRWLKTKFRFKYLQKTWDPEFSEGAFIYGTTKAVCKITEIINKDKPQELDDLLTETARLKLIDDMSSRLTKLQKKIIRLRPDDIKILVPIAVNLKTKGARKECEVSLRSLALKWFEEGNSLKLVLVALQTDFIRDYSEGAKPEWTINIYDILECAMLSEAPSSAP